MTLAVERQIDLRWTDLIEREWVNSLERRMAKRLAPSASERFAKTAALMRKSVPGYNVPG